MIRAPALIALPVVASALAARAADTVLVNFPTPALAAFCGAELALPARIENRGAEATGAKFSTRLWQMSSATVAPLGEAAPWWEGRVGAGESAEVSVKIVVPEFRAATRLRVQVLAADGTPVGRAEFVALPQEWLRGELAALPARLGLHDPAERLGPALAKLGIDFTLIRNAEQLADFTGACAIIIAAHDAPIRETAERVASRGRAIVFVSDVAPAAPSALVAGTLPPDSDFVSSATAQFQLVQWLREALRRKNSPTSKTP